MLTRQHKGKWVFCADAIFATQETIGRYVREGGRVYICLYDFQKAFDSAEIHVLLDQLYKAGLNGKAWRLLKEWYTGGVCCVKVGKQ